MSDVIPPDLIEQIPDEIWDAFYSFLGSFLLFVMIIIISIWKNVGMERTFIFALVRGFIQLMILASALFFIFQLEGLFPLFGVLFVMITFGARTAAQRVENVRNVFQIEFIALIISVSFVMISMSILQVIPTDDPSFWIPIGGMVTGNSMNISYLTLDRIQNDVRANKHRINAALSLGATPEVVVNRLGIISSALKVGITPNTNNLKTLGLVFIPGLMTGLLIGGLHPVAAAFLQIMIFFLILGGGLLSAVIASFLITRNLFDMEHQALPTHFESG